MNTILRDLLYFDIGKATSLLSQLEGGLRNEIQESEESTTATLGELGAGISLLKGSVGKEASKRARVETTRTLHHDMLITLEEWLFTHGFALDLNKASENVDVSAVQFRDLISGVSYVRAEGPTIIDDFANLTSITKNFKTLIDFINRCSRSTLEKSDAYVELQDQISEQKKLVKKVKDRNERAVRRSQLEATEQALDKLTRQLTEVDAPDDWLLEGITDWIALFNENQIHLRVRPFADNSIEITANLKREYFVDDDTSHLLFSYDSTPNIDLTVLGLITSVPPITISEFQANNLTVAQEADDHSTRVRHFESAFRNVFVSMNQMRSFSEFSTYPNIKIHPIAVYRKITSYFEDEQL